MVSRSSSGVGISSRTLWFNGIRDGLVAAGNPRAAEALTAADLHVAFFGDLFRPPGTMATAEPPYLAADIEPGLESDLLAVFFEAAVAPDPALGPPEGAMGLGRAIIQVTLNRLARSNTFIRVGERGFVGNLRQVTAFLTNPTVKQDVLARLRERISSDTRIVIGHSLGSVVAYEYLCHDRPASVELLVTLGSLLGIPNVVFDKLIAAPVDGVGTWPARVITWVNVAAPDDIVVLRKVLGPLFPGTVQGQAVADRVVDNGDESHAIYRYLNTRQTGSAIGNVLG